MLSRAIAERPHHRVEAVQPPRLWFRWTRRRGNPWSTLEAHPNSEQDCPGGPPCPAGSGHPFPVWRDAECRPFFCRGGAPCLPAALGSRIECLAIRLNCHVVNDHIRVHHFVLLVGRLNQLYAAPWPGLPTPGHRFWACPYFAGREVPAPAQNYSFRRDFSDRSSRYLYLRCPAEYVGSRQPRRRRNAVDGCRDRGLAAMAMRENRPKHGRWTSPVGRTPDQGRKVAARPSTAAPRRFNRTLTFGIRLVSRQ